MMRETARRTAAFCIRAAIAFAVIAVAAPVALAADKPADPGGVWFTQGHRSAVRFVPCGGGWCGRIDRILQRDPGSPDHDVKNPDPALRSRPVLGLQLLDLPGVQDGQWRGTVYDPRSGRTYNASVRRVSGDGLEVKGCLMIFCQTVRWTAR